MLERSWFWMVTSGVADLILAAIIILGWPGSLAWALGLVVGINLFISGIALVMTAIACRNVNDTSAQTTPLQRTA